MTVTLTRPAKGLMRCGFCNDGNHAKCVVGTMSSTAIGEFPVNKKIHLCLCEEGGCQLGRIKCVRCNNRVTEEVNPDTWECFDAEACRSTVEARRENSPLSRFLRENMERFEMAKTEKATAKKATAKKAAAAPKEGSCLCCGGKTKGGLFLPGHDARHVSTLVESVMSPQKGSLTEKQARDQLKKDGVSEKLLAKFDKSLGLAQEKAAKREKADAKAS